MVKQTPKMTALVVSAIRNLREVQGSTPREIMNYIQAEYNASSPTSDSAIQRKLVTALKRGLEYGILKRIQGHYSLNADPETVAPTEDMLMGPLERGCCSKRARGRRSRKGGCKRRSRRKRKRAGCGGRKRRRGRKSRCKSRRRRRSRGGKKCGKRRRRCGGRSSRRRSRRSKCRSRREGEDVDMLAKDPIEPTGGRHREDIGDSYAYEREERRSRSRGRQSAGSRSRSPTHSRSSGSSDREGNERDRRDRQVK